MKQELGKGYENILNIFVSFSFFFFNLCEFKESYYVLDLLEYLFSPTACYVDGIE